MKEFIQHYKVYEDGRVQRIDKGAHGACGGIEGKFLKPELCSNGYRRVTLCHKGKTKRIGLHRLVAMVHLPNPENLKVVNHLDGNPLNNHVSNLEWTTYSGNLKHAYDVLKRDRMFGTRRKWALLDDDKVRAIKENKEGLTVHERAKLLGVHYATVMDVLCGRTWTHVI